MKNSAVIYATVTAGEERGGFLRVPLCLFARFCQLLIRGIERIERFIRDGAVKVTSACEAPRGNVVVLDEDFPGGVTPVAQAALIQVDSLPGDSYVHFGKVAVKRYLCILFNEAVNGFLFVG